MPYKFVGWAILGAVLLASLFSFQAFIPFLYSSDQEQFRWGFNAVPIFIRYLLWALFLPIIFNIYRTFYANVLKHGPYLLFVLLLFMLFALAHSAIIWGLYLGYSATVGELVINDGLIEHVIRTVYAGAVSSGIELLLIVMGIGGWIFYQKVQQDKLALVQLQRQLSDAQLTALRMQLNPHFLFNSFNSVASLIDSAPNKAKDMLDDVATLMRQILKQDQRHSTTLGEEVEFVACYLAVEQMRFSDRLNVNLDIPADLKTCLVPNLILQPLIENCFKHAFASKVGECTLVVKARANIDKLCLEVVDNGELNNTSTRGLGIGLENCRKRLKQMYGSEADMSFTPIRQGCSVRLLMPLQKLEI